VLLAKARAGLDLPAMCIRLPDSLHRHLHVRWELGVEVQSLPNDLKAVAMPCSQGQKGQTLTVPASIWP
jgi:hypothetical protein